MITRNYCYFCSVCNDVVTMEKKISLFFRCMLKHISIKCHYVCDLLCDIFSEKVNEGLPWWRSG